MVVRHNLSAMNSHRQLGINNSSTAKNLEKLSSGFKINRAGDDAAGLAISEKMRGQIRGLDMATQNAENGVSLIQTAEGALNETHSILQRIRELAVQSSNGTYHDAVDRENLNKEVQALKGEIDRISSSTHYNGIKLLDGSMGGKTLTSSAVDNDVAMREAFGRYSGLSSFTIGLTSAGVNLLGGKAGDVFNATLVTTSLGNLNEPNGYPMTHYYLQIDDKTFSFDTRPDGKMAFTDENGVEAGFFFGYFAAQISEGVITNIQLEIDSPEANATIYRTFTRLDAAEGAIVAGPNSKLEFQIGANGTADQRVGLHVNNMSTANLGDKMVSDYNRNGSVAFVNVSTREAANDAIRVLDAAINQVSGTRADLGAMQNRLEHAINNLGVARENLQDAESSIRDVDMAKEMMDFTKNNILAQASQSMLAQANQLTQGITQLLAA